MKKKALSLLLVLVMVLSMLPVSSLATGLWGNLELSENLTAEAEEITLNASDDTSDFYRILHLDCGRKYFSKDWIIALLYEMSAAGYNQLQLAFGNDGLRFLLKDMSFTANGTTYDHETVVSKVEAGNKAQNTSGDSRWLTQAEMDEIIAKANELNIDVVPLLNLPGHANAILDIADDSYNASGSDNTLDVANSDAAIEFGYAIFQKYVDYFAAKGCKFFNFGADEYANDASGTFSFSRLNSTQYAKFVGFINKLASYIEGKGMTPRSFNDGLYYNGQSASIDTSIQCCYWSSGWGSYPVAAASTIAGKGHAMINTNGDYYYVLGKDDKFDSGYSYASNFSNTAFMGSTISSPVGSMFCIWCDYPNAETDTQVAQKVRLPLRAMAARMQDQSIDTISTDVLTNGFKADGNINVTAPVIQIDGSTEPAPNTITNGDQVNLTLGQPATWTSSDETVITLASADTTGVAALATEITATNVTAKAVGAGTATIKATTASGSTATLDITVQDQTTGATQTETIELTVGGTATKTVSGTYTAPATDNASIASVTGKTETVGGSTTYNLVTDLKDGTFYIYNSASATAPTTQLTLENAGNGTYYLKNSDGDYIYPDASYESFYGYYNYWSYSLKTGKVAVTISARNNGFIFSRSVTSSNESTTAYLTWTSSRGFRSSGDTTTLYLYEKVVTEGQPETTLTFTGTGEGTTFATIGDTKYNINVTAPVTNETKSLVYGGSFELPANAEVVDNYDTSLVTVANGKVTALQKDGEATVTVVTKNQGGKVTARYIYKVTVSKEDLSTVTPLTLEHWITNAEVGQSKGSTNQTSVAASDLGVNTENGIDISGKKFDPGYKTDGTVVEYWKAVRLPSDQKQDESAGNDKTGVGTTILRIRYYNSVWQYLTEEENWVSFASGDQVVLYYLQKTDVTKEVTTYVKDWGPKKENWGGLDYLNNSYVLLDYTVKYESGQETPSSFPTSNSLAFHSENLSVRDLGLTQAKVNENGYEVYLITVTPSEDSQSNTLSGYNAKSNTSYEYNGTEKVAWAASAHDFEVSGLTKYTSINGKYTYSEGGEPTVQGVEIYKQHAMKITFYVRAVATEDSLTVHYIDSSVTPNVEFYNYNITVASGTTFNSAIALSDGSVVNGDVENKLGNTQTVSADLTTMPQIGAAYRYSSYQCVRLERSEDGKDVYLYYTIDNTHSFIIDFGTSVVITKNDLSLTDSATSTTVTGAKFGEAEVANDAITYTPNKALTDVELLHFTRTDKEGNSATHQIYLIPASNVLYEESFFTPEKNSGWSIDNTTTQLHENTQQTQKAGAAGNVFGYDDAYASATGAQGVYKAENLSTKAITGQLTTSFYGNAFDLIGNCGTDTGRVLMLISGNGKNYIYDVDTRYSAGTLNQVPLAHAELGTDANYTVKICAAGLDATTASGNANAASTFSVSGSADALTLFLAENDLTAADVEIISVTPDLVAYASAISVNDLAEATAVSHAEGTHVEIDAFRVYRSSNNANYPTAEQNVQYVNCLDAVNGEVLTAYTEGGTVTNIKVGEYEGSGGPQNEIYLAKNQSVTFGVTGMKVVQVSLRAVSGATSWNGTAISSNTEMYYNVTANENDLFTVTNTGDNLLAIGNLKLANGAVVQSASDFSTEMLLRSVQATMASAPVETEPEYDPFVDVKLRTTSLLRKKLVTLTITTSTDVETLTVNGYKLNPVNKWMVQTGRATTYTYILADTVSKNTTKTYEITAFNANGQSCTVTKQA